MTRARDSRTGEEETRARTDFEAWMQARQHHLLRTAYLLTGEVHAAEDLVQTALAKLYLAWDRVRAADSVDAYARRVLVNEHASRWRRLWRRREVLADTRAYDVAVTDTHYDGVAESLWEAVRALPERQRAALVLRYYEQLSEKETAAALGITVGTVKSQTSRALDALRARLGGRDDLAGREAHR